MSEETSLVHHKLSAPTSYERCVLITGATKGIGLATSKRLQSHGYQIIGIAREKPTGDFPGALFLCDLSDKEKTANTIHKIRNDHHIDAIVHNVGIAHPQALGAINLDLLDEVYDLNVRTAVQITQGFIDKMKEKTWGRIINISSRAILGMIDRTSYVAAKSALIGCTRVWALELAAFGITVNAIAPGPIETELFRKNHKAGSREEKAALASIPMGRIGQPQEIAATIEFLLSEDAGFITGQTIFVDGGGSLPSSRLE